MYLCIFAVLQIFLNPFSQVLLLFSYSPLIKLYLKQTLLLSGVLLQLTLIQMSPGALMKNKSTQLDDTVLVTLEYSLVLSLLMMLYILIRVLTLVHIQIYMEVLALLLHLPCKVYIS